MKEYVVCNVNTGLVHDSFDLEDEAASVTEKDRDALIVIHRSKVERMGFQTHDDYINSET